MKTASEHVVILQWGCWALINMTISHPPNKREFVTVGGLVLIMKLLKANSSSVEFIQQALGLSYCIIVPDKDAKMNLSQVRQSVFADGLVAIVQDAQKSYGEQSSDLSDLCQSILNVLMIDFS